MKTGNRIKNEKGFSLVEIIIVLALLGIVIASIYTFYFYIQKSFNRTDARSNMNHQMNMVFIQMDKDIRSASKPNRDTLSVRVVSSKEMHIYIYDTEEEEYGRIVYQFNSDGGILRRGEAVCETTMPPSTANPPYGTIEWETVMVGAVESTKTINDDMKEEINFGFEDVTNPATNDRREIKITLIGNDVNKPLDNPIIMKKTLTSRSKGFPE